MKTVEQVIVYTGPYYGQVHDVLECDEQRLCLLVKHGPSRAFWVHISELDSHAQDEFFRTDHSKKDAPL
jgi:hypothetical protein